MRDKRRPTVGDSTSTVRTSEIDERFFAAIADMLGDTQDGLAGTEIDVALCAFDIRSEGPSCCKKSRLQDWVQSFDREPAGHEKIHKLLELAISLARFSKFSWCFSISQNTSNKTLLPLEWEIDEAGQLRPTQLARSIKQAHWRAGDLRHALEGQQVHRNILEYNREERVRDNYSRAVFEAVKGLFERIRETAGIDEDSWRVVEMAFGGNTPALTINTLLAATDTREQRGLVSMLKGSYAMFRNPLADQPEATWAITNQDALDLFSSLSLVHRRLDRAASVGSAEAPGAVRR